MNIISSQHSELQLHKILMLELDKEEAVWDPPALGKKKLHFP